ncbi:non-specific lipid-transfer protein 2 [Quercus suber]|uniref:Non-specific lipid-transfer protein 2 n=1 Tax=Quercus suber TaxID=58331 RepID=A0AAW0LRX6_QUESU
MTSTPPSSLCCHNVREQRPCLCEYLKDPNLKQYINSPNARKVASTCGVSFPNC